MMRKPGVVWGVLALTVLASAMAWAVVRRTGPSEDRAAPVPLVFTAQEVVRAQPLVLERRIEFSGPLVAPQTAQVRSRVPATLLALDVAEGQRVQAGQRLGRLDLGEVQARLLERQAQLAQVQASALQAERTHASNQRLAEQHFLSPLALENSRAALDASRAQVQAAQAQVASLQLTLRDAALVSPIAGIVARRLAVAGEKLAAEQPVLSIVDLRQLEMAGTVGTHEVGALQAGQAVAVQVEGEPAARPARIARIAPAAEAGTRAIGVVVALANPDERLRAGQYAVARVTLPGEGPQPTLPLTALAQASGQEHVWTIEQGRLVRRAVTTGRRDPVLGRVEVLRGLPEGAVVLGGRFENLREGAPASVAAVPGTPAASH